MICFVCYIFIYHHKNDAHFSTPEKNEPKNVKIEIARPYEKAILTNSKESALLSENKNLILKKTYLGKDSLCLNIKDNVFLLPRQIAAKITKERNYIFYLPSEYSECLKVGNIKFWVIEYDRQSLFPYRFYFEFSAIISELNTLKVNDSISNNNFVESSLSLLNSIFPKIDTKSTTRVRISEPFVTIKNFTISNRFPIFGQVLNEPPSPNFSNAILLDDNINPNNLTRDTYVPPSHSNLNEKIQKWDESKNIFMSESPFDLNISNLEVAYFLNFRKRPFFYIKKGTSSQIGNQFTLVHANLIPKINSDYIFIDLRPLKASKNFNLINQLKINAKLNGAAYFGSVHIKLENDKLLLETKNFYKEKIAENIDLLNSKYLILVGLTQDDPLVRLFFNQLSEFQKKNTFILNEGFYDLILRNYFFREKYFFNKEDEDILSNEESILPFLLFKN